MTSLRCYSSVSSNTFKILLESVSNQLVSEFYINLGIIFNYHMLFHKEVNFSKIKSVKHPLLAFKMRDQMGIGFQKYFVSSILKIEILSAKKYFEYKYKILKSGVLA